MARDANDGEMPQSDYQVFLSFRGCDTRQGFTDSLYHFLTDAGVRVFRDNEELRPGHRIEEVLTAINKSIVCIPILSQNYANSKWCLFELAKMVKLEKDIMPIFYKVEVDDVKLATKLYSDQLSKFGKEFDAKKEEWKSALKEVGSIFDRSYLEETFEEVGGIKAWRIMDSPGYGELCKEVVREVLNKLEVKHKIFEGPLVGIDDHVEVIKNLLCIGSSDVRFVVIHGVGGVGKTTLSKVIFNKFCEGFNRCCFLSDVRETTNRHGIVYLQNKLLKEIGSRIPEISDSDDGIKTIKDIVKNKKVLIILDDADQRKQIENLAGDPAWFNLGSRIIVTTRDPSCIAEHREVCCYNLSEMSSDHALQLFSKHAFKTDSPPVDYLHISKKVVAACGRLPLALQIMGSHLRQIDKEDWESKSKMIASQRSVQEKLMITFNILDSRTKEIFLDIACFFAGSEINYPTYMWEACDFRPDEGIECLLSMSLIKISDNNTFWMHDVLQDLGREIVVQENLKRPERRSRLWSSKEVFRVLSRQKGTSDIDALHFNPRFAEASEFGSLHSRIRGNHMRPGANLRLRFQMMGNQMRPLQNLRFLKLFLVGMEGDFKDALQDLKWLSGHGLFLSRGVTNLELKDLVILDLSHSYFSFDLFEKIVIGKNIKVLNLSNFWAQDSLDLPESLGKLRSLVELDISHSPFKLMPSSIGNLKNLRVMRMDYSEIEELPSSIGNLAKLEELSATGSHLTYIPQDIGRLHQLKILNLAGSKIHQLPSTIDKLTLLQRLRLEDCNNIQELPNLPSSLTILIVSSERLWKLPLLLNLKHQNALLLRGDMKALDLPEQHLSSKASWINDCPLLKHFDLAFRNITHIQMETSAFPHLERLRLRCPDLSVIGELPLSLMTLHLSSIIAEIKLPTCLGRMEALNELYLTECRFIGRFLLPEHLKTLRIGRCSFPEDSIDLSRLKMLQHLKIRYCEKLMAVRGVEYMKLLEKVTVFGCPSLKEISDISKFERLVVRTNNLSLFEGIREIIVEDSLKDDVDSQDADDSTEEELWRRPPPRYGYRI